MEAWPVSGRGRPSAQQAHPVQALRTLARHTLTCHNLDARPRAKHQDITRLDRDELVPDLLAIQEDAIGRGGIAEDIGTILLEEEDSVLSRHCRIRVGCDMRHHGVRA